MNRIYEFGDFRVHPAEQLLLYKGQPVALTPKVFETLVILLESDGRLIDKNDFIDKLWPGVFVEDVALAQNISHLRKALGDGTNGTSIIQTVPKRGYRFVTPVIRVADEPTDVQNQRFPARDVGPPSSTHRIEEAESGALATGELARPKRSNKLGLAIAIVLLACGVGTFLFFSHSRRKALTETDTVVLGDFDNSTGDPVFDATLRQGTAVQLQQSPFLSLVTDDRTRQVLRMMGQPVDARLTPAIAREICKRNGSAAVLDGSIAALGSQYVIGLRATDCGSGRVLAEEQVQATRKEDVLNALDQIARKVRTRLGESLPTIEKYDTPLAEATTPSLEALKAFSLGVNKSYLGAGVLPYFSRAIELDPNFAMAYAVIAGIYSSHREHERATEMIRKAFALRDRVSERERLMIDASYYEIGTGELEKAVSSLELFRQIYPRDRTAHVGLGVIYRRLGYFDKALEESSEAHRMFRSAVSYQNLAADYVNLNRLGEAEAVYKEAVERNLQALGLGKSRYLLAFLKGDTTQMSQLAEEARGKPREDEILYAQAETEEWYGRVRSAREFTQRAIDVAERDDARETAADYQALEALYEADVGDQQQSRADALAVLKPGPNRSVQEMAALVMAKTGDTAGAERLAAGLDKAFPVDTMVQRKWLPLIRAAIALSRNDPARAVELLQGTAAYELAGSVDVGSPSMQPAYLRGEAYLMLHDGNRAAAEYQKFIDYRSFVRNSPWGALSRLGLARAYAMQGDTVKARAAYQDFLALWKDADSNVPLLQQAKAEYSKLQ